MGHDQSDLSRRRFLSTSLGLLASAGLASAVPTRSTAAPVNNSTPTVDGEPVYRTLGRTGLRVPVVSMGAGACSDPGLVQACYEAGMRYFDTAGGYSFGRNEQMVARAIGRLGVRDKIALGTKGLTPAERRNATPEQLKKRLLASLEGSLRRLKTDMVEIFMIHEVADPAVLADPTIKETLAEIKTSGRAKAVGAATHANMAAVINAAVDNGIYDIVLTSYNFTMADDADLAAAIARAGSQGVAVIAMKTQAGGAAFPNPETLREFDAATINSAALKWVLHNENIKTTIPGITTYDHMRANIAVARHPEYTETEKRFLSDNRIRLGMGFCRQCRRCLVSCPNGVEIPELMRTHMYAAQYSDFLLARTTLDQIPAGHGLATCSSCGSCRAECANSVPIGRKIAELKLIYA